MKFRKKKYLLIIRTQLGSKIFLQKKIKCCYNAVIHVNFPHRLYSIGRLAMPVPRGGQEPLPLKVAPIQPSVTAAFHLQSRRDSDCQMWEISHIRHSRAGRTLLRSSKECGRLWMLLHGERSAGRPPYPVWHVYWFLSISTRDIKLCNNLYLSFFTADDNHLQKSTTLSSVMCRYAGHQQSLHQPKFDHFFFLKIWSWNHMEVLR